MLVVKLCDRASFLLFMLFCPAGISATQLDTNSKLGNTEGPPNGIASSVFSFSTCCFSIIGTATTATNPLISSPSTSIAKPHRFVSKLIHPHSVLHPHYNSNETAKDRMERDIKHSIARVAYFQARIKGSQVLDDYRANLYPAASQSSILANFSIGHPPIPQLLVMDTASHLLWVMCIPCSNCVPHPGRIFDPSKSSTYSPLCRSPTCGYNSLDQLKYNVTYADNTFISGTLASEHLVFETSDEGTSEVFNVEFGCGHNIWFNREPGYNGILGLNNNPVSLASQIGNKFSYCLGSITESNYNYNQLILGEGAYLEGYSTPFEVFDSMYYITMEGISVGKKSITTAPATFERKADGTGGVLIDSGSTITFLVDEAYRVLFKEIKNILDGSFREVRYINAPWLLCYLGTLSRDLIGFPVVTFHFAGGADLALDNGSFFLQTTDDIFCMTVGPISATSLWFKPSVIGLLAQQSYNIGYDLNNQDIYFQRIDCELLTG